MKLQGKTIYFRLVELSDAKFIQLLRVDPQYNKHLSQVEDDYEKQVEWLKEYKEREKKGIEFYYIIHRISDSIPIGTVRMYDFIGERDSFCWGSWILNENKTRYAALECALMIYDLAFIDMGFKRCHMDIRKQNIKVIDFHKKLGVKIIGETKEDYLGHYFPNDYKLVRDEIRNIVGLESEKL